MPGEWPLKWFVDDWKFGVIALAVTCIAAPPVLSRGFAHIRARRKSAEGNVEISLILRGFESRAANLIHKFEEVFAGEVKNTYQNHLLSDCQHYFASRTRPGDVTISSEVAFEVNYYELVKKPRSTLLERKLYTNSDSSRMRSKFSSNGKPDERLAIERISAGKHVYCGDVLNQSAIAEHQITDGPTRAYKCFLSVPVFRDRKAVGDDRVVGMLSVNATMSGLIRESDKRILLTYAWFLSVALAADALAKGRKAVSKRSSGV